MRFTKLTHRTIAPPITLPEGSILVVGSGQTGCQIAEELNDAGCRTYLSTGKSGRLPRRYRGRDSLEWQLDLGLLDRTPDMLESPSDRFRGDPHVTGKGGGRTLSLHKFRRQGITLLGHLQAISGTFLYFKEDVYDHLLFADQFSLEFMTTVDEHIERKSLMAPLPTQEEIDGGPLSTDKEMKHIRSLDMQENNIQTIVWATGFSFDFSWVDFSITDDFGYPIAKDGITDVTGLYFCGLNWMSKRKSGIIFGVHEDAHSVALDIANRS